MRKFGLIGYPLGHSFSKKHFEEKFKKEEISDACFELFPIQSIHSLPELISAEPDLKGFAVTVPYKKQVLTFLDEFDPGAKEIGAVNCIKIQQGKLIGYNTDAIGFEKMLPPNIVALHRKALILGTGGASACVQYVLNKLGISFQLVSRNPKLHDRENVIGYDDLSGTNVADYTLIVNATPQGMAPNIEAFPELPYVGITEKHFLIDLIYNPAETVFLKKGKAFGATIMNGHQMFVEQAEANWRIWND